MSWYLYMTDIKKMKLKMVSIDNILIDLCQKKFVEILSVMPLSQVQYEFVVHYNKVAFVKYLR